MFMQRWLRAFSVGFALFAGSIAAATPGQGADILFTAKGTFDWFENYQVGFDHLGLDGATFTFTATFSDASHYQLFYDGYPGIFSLDDSLTITGATGAGVNGTYSAGGFGVILLPTFAGQFYGDADFDGGGGYAAWNIGSFRMRTNRLTTSKSGPTNGSLFQASDISTTKHADASFSVSGFVGNFSGQIDAYLINDFQASVTVVPEPSSLALAGLAAGCLFVRARLRKSRI